MCILSRDTYELFHASFSDAIKPWQASNSCNTGTSTLLDICAQARGHTAPKALIFVDVLI